MSAPTPSAWAGLCPQSNGQVLASPYHPLQRANWLYPPSASVRFQAVPWGNFDLERMRVTDLAAAQG